MSGSDPSRRKSATTSPVDQDGTADDGEPQSDRRSEIERVALRLFLRQGFAATSVREITTAVGVTVPTLYYHFGSKDGLLESLVEELVAEGDEVNVRLAGQSGARLPSRALASYYDVVTRHLDIFRLVMADPSVRSHDVAGHRLAEQGACFLNFLTNGSTDRNDEIRAHAALGALRRPLRRADFDREQDRAQILASARAALKSRA